MRGDWGTLRSVGRARMRSKGLPALSILMLVMGNAALSRADDPFLRRTATVDVVERVARAMTQKRIHVVDSSILVMGLTFKENCPDLRNTRTIDIITELSSYGMTVDVWDPWVNPAEAQHEYGIDPIATPENGAYDAIVLAVSHRQFAKLGIEKIRGFGVSNGVLFDVKYLFPADQTDGRL